VSLDISRKSTKKHIKLNLQAPKDKTER